MSNTVQGFQQLTTSRVRIPSGVVKKRRLDENPSVPMESDAANFSIQDREFLFALATGTKRDTESGTLQDQRPQSEVFSDFNGVRYAEAGLYHDMMNTRPMGISMQEVRDGQGHQVGNHDMAVQIGGTASVFNSGPDSFFPGETFAVLPWPRQTDSTYRDFSSKFKPNKGQTAKSKRGVVRKVTPNLINEILTKLHESKKNYDPTDGAKMQKLWEELKSNKIADEDYYRAITALHAHYTHKVLTNLSAAKTGATFFDAKRSNDDDKTKLRALTNMLRSSWLDAARLLSMHTRGTVLSNANAGASMDVLLVK